jgi:hypothetical protein
MRRRLSLAVVLFLLVVFAAVPAASAVGLPLSVVPVSMVEPGSLLLLGAAFFVLASVAQRALRLER